MDKILAVLCAALVLLSSGMSASVWAGDSTDSTEKQIKMLEKQIADQEAAILARGLKYLQDKKASDPQHFTAQDQAMLDEAQKASAQSQAPAHALAPIREARPAEHKSLPAAVAAAPAPPAQTPNRQPVTRAELTKMESEAIHAAAAVLAGDDSEQATISANKKVGDALDAFGRLGTANDATNNAENSYIRMSALNTAINILESRQKSDRRNFSTDDETNLKEYQKIRLTEGVKSLNKAEEIREKALSETFPMGPKASASAAPPTATATAPAMIGPSPKQESVAVANKMPVQDEARSAQTAPTSRPEVSAQARSVQDSHAGPTGPVPPPAAMPPSLDQAAQAETASAKESRAATRGAPDALAPGSSEEAKVLSLSADATNAIAKVLEGDNSEQAAILAEQKAKIALDAYGKLPDVDAAGIDAAKNYMRRAAIEKAVKDLAAKHETDPEIAATNRQAISVYKELLKTPGTGQAWEDSLQATNRNNLDQANKDINSIKSMRLLSVEQMTPEQKAAVDDFLGVAEEYHALLASTQEAKPAGDAPAATAPAVAQTLDASSKASLAVAPTSSASEQSPKQASQAADRSPATKTLGSPAALLQAMLPFPWFLTAAATKAREMTASLKTSLNAYMHDVPATPAATAPATPGQSSKPEIRLAKDTTPAAGNARTVSSAPSTAAHAPGTGSAAVAAPVALNPSVPPQTPDAIIKGQLADVRQGIQAIQREIAADNNYPRSIRNSRLKFHNSTLSALRFQERNLQRQLAVLQPAPVAVAAGLAPVASKSTATNRKDLVKKAQRMARSLNADSRTPIPVAATSPTVPVANSATASSKRFYRSTPPMHGATLLAGNQANAYWAQYAARKAKVAAKRAKEREELNQSPVRTEARAYTQGRRPTLFGRIGNFFKHLFSRKKGNSYLASQ